MEHNHCYHEFGYCAQCDQVWCKKCSKSWGQHSGWSGPMWQIPGVSIGDAYPYDTITTTNVPSGAPYVTSMHSH